MSNIVWKKSSELEDFSKKFAARQDFILFGTIEKISKQGDSVKVNLFDKDKTSYGVWFNVTEDFNVEALEESESPLIAFTAKIETFLGKDERYVTNVTLTSWTDCWKEPESTLLTIENVSIIDKLPTDQKGLDLFKIQRVRGDQDQEIPEFYHIRWYSKEPKTLKACPATVHVRLGLTKHQIDKEGVRKVGIENFSYEKDGETISGSRYVYKLCLTLESIDWAI